VTEEEITLMMREATAAEEEWLQATQALEAAQ
jgi:hypothetical protein